MILNENRFQILSHSSSRGAISDNIYVLKGLISDTGYNEMQGCQVAVITN